MTNSLSDISLCITDVAKLSEHNVTELALVLGDQLNAKHSWFKTPSASRLIVLMEVRQETDYVTHHIQKVIGFFAAMRQFAQALAKAGHRVFYFSLDAAHNQQDIVGNLRTLQQQLPHLAQFMLQQPDEYRLDQQLQAFAQQHDTPVVWADTEHFLCQRNVLDEWFPNTKNIVMESFYRRMRRVTGYLMKNNAPIGGTWNFDKQNRHKFSAEEAPPAPLCFSHDVSDLVDMVQQHGVKTIGDIDAKRFLWPVNRKEARQLLRYFLQQLLPNFGRYQDAMHTEHWALYHARIAFALNSKMLSPQEVVERAITHWQAHQDSITIAQIEGFVRQIIGWREFVRGIYWQHMPNYAKQNYFSHQRALPDFFWHGKTQMACLAHAIGQSLTFAYAHHIQRLMVTGNFALLIGAHPDAVDAWYLGIYNDAIEWVEMPNTRGMSQYADGGVLATKPYISSGAYINKMSNYCGQCVYSVDKKVGNNACPFNSLYWNFIDQHYEKLQRNPRMGLMLNQWQQRSDADKQSVREQASYYLDHINQL